MSACPRVCVPAYQRLHACVPVSACPRLRARPSLRLLLRLRRVCVNVCAPVPAPVCDSVSD
eukprot:63043-Lingulodinium_polyedra.AAC.1